jgi:lipopolysaccharide biosynthesis regulator YciM
VTLTLAGLYVKQGLVGRAREIYKQLADGPDESTAAEARKRLSELPSAGLRIAILEELLTRVRSRR